MFDFETVVRRGPGNLKRMFTPESVTLHGNVSFDGAEPDYPTAPCIREAVEKLAENGLYGFTLMEDSYRERVRWWLEHSRGVRIEPEWIVPSLGTVHALGTCLRLMPEDGRMGVMAPVYNRFAQAADRLEKPWVSCRLQIRDGRYAMDMDALEDMIRREHVRLLVVCSPHNPVGRVWEREELEAVADICRRHQTVIFSDEIFGDNVYSGHRFVSFLEIPGARDMLITAVSLGKAFGLTGLNHANILIPSPVLRSRFEDRRTRDHYGSMDPLAHACVMGGYTPEGLEWVKASNRVCEENIRLVREAFTRLFPGCRVYGGEGAYVLWMDLRPFFNSEEDMLAFLYEKAFFHVDAGSAYGEPGFVRMCVASPVHCVKKALNDLEKALEERKTC